ncbi:hypothetical protein INT48_005384 [Thamnidium elegans]|uniref:Uncharacterized protein n=1 Tax=Thamnidium elegans TaxID=101142 RepID=A0A8H7VRL8_9FUNG|nr:hypothetical protein INT48_005384 [Thamnidium elegans]
MPVKYQNNNKPFTWKSAVVLGITAVGLGVYFDKEVKQHELLREKRERAKLKRLGKPNVGRPFNLINANEGKRMDSQQVMQGKFSLIYFGFTHCPDICPEELDKMAAVVDEVKKEFGPNVLIPIFITCDPLRDTEPVVKEYVQDFHPDLIGFTGTEQEIKQVAKSFRVYSFKPANVSADDDYLVDHSIFFYLMDPEGNFVDCYARDTTAEEVLTSFKNYMQDYIDEGGKITIK